jgi:hypothetical protein
MHPYLSQAVAQARIDDLHRDASERGTPARAAVRTPRRRFGRRLAGALGRAPSYPASPELPTVRPPHHRPQLRLGAGSSHDGTIPPLARPLIR